jgi:hypothetical protein
MMRSMLAAEILFTRDLKFKKYQFQPHYLNFVKLRVRKSIGMKLTENMIDRYRPNANEVKTRRYCWIVVVVILLLRDLKTCCSGNIKYNLITVHSLIPTI